jgi:hypothetical protein
MVRVLSAAIRTSLIEFLGWIRQAHPQIAVTETLTIEHLNRFLRLARITRG